jgi:signal transduction histidine kinase
MTSAVVFGVGLLALSAVYAALIASARNLTEARTIRVVDPSGRVVGIAAAEFRTVEGVVREAILDRLAFVTIIVLAAMFLVSLVVGWIVAGRALRPVGRITQVAREIEATDLSRRIGPVGYDDELTRIASTFDSMLDRLDAAFEGQKRAIAQTSHDLRTPLAVIRSNLDVTLADPEASTDDWRNTGEITLRAAERMSIMVEDLLRAARNEVGVPMVVEVNLAELVGEIGVEAAARAAGEDVAVAVETEPVVIRGDRSMLTRAVGNLFDNALRQAPPGTEIVLSSGAVDGWAFMAVADRGPGVDPAVVRGTKSIHGGGLGLTIVRSIAASMGGDLDGGPRAEGEGSVVAVWLPLSEQPPPRAVAVPAL